MKLRLVLCLACCAWPAASLRAQQHVRFYEENGVTYRETKEIVRRPVTETRLEDRPRTVYLPEAGAATQKCYRTVRVPITEYRTMTRWVNRYNPFAQPYLVEDRVPVVRWEYRTEEVTVAVPGTRMVAQTVAEKVPVQTRRIVEEEVTRRVAVSGPGLRDAQTIAREPAASPVVGAFGAAGSASPSSYPASDPFAPSQPSSQPAAQPSYGAYGQAPTPVSSTPAIGGVAKLESDPPRQGTSGLGSGVAPGASSSINAGWRQAIPQPVRR